MNMNIIAKEKKMMPLNAQFVVARIRSCFLFPLANESQMDNLVPKKVFAAFQRQYLAFITMFVISSHRKWFTASFALLIFKHFQWIKQLKCLGFCKLEWKFTQETHESLTLFTVKKGIKCTFQMYRRKSLPVSPHMNWTRTGVEKIVASESTSLSYS